MLVALKELGEGVNFALVYITKGYYTNALFYPSSIYSWLNSVFYQAVRNIMDVKMYHTRKLGGVAISCLWHRAW